MRSRKPSDHLFGDSDLPTTSDDVAFLRRQVSPPASGWLEELGSLARQMPNGEIELRRRRTFAGLPPFEL